MPNGLLGIRSSDIRLASEPTTVAASLVDEIEIVVVIIGGLKFGDIGDSIAAGM